jgi:hypothetical protein
MILKSFGCSFIFGSELSDDIELKQGVHYPLTSRITGADLYMSGSQLTWPALSAKELGYTYQCYARPGVGNLQIADQVINHAANNEPAFYVIGWTWIDRFDYVVNSPDSGSDYKWKTILPADNTDLTKIYYRDLHSEYKDKLTALITIRSTIDTLKQKNIPFVMTYIDELLFDFRWNITAAVADLQKYIQPYMTKFDGKNFLEWSKQNGYPIGKALHPLEQAHRAAADYMLQLGVYKK